MNVQDAFYNTVHDAVGGAESLAPRMGMTAAILRNKADSKKEHNKPLLVDADRIMGLTNDYRILHALAQNHGFICIPKDSNVPASDSAVLDIVTHVWMSEGQVGSTVNQTLADGKVEMLEVEKVEAAVYHLEQMLEVMVKRLKGMAEK